MSSNFFGGDFFGGGFFGTSDVTKTGTGGLDPKRRTLRRPIFKPTGLIDRQQATPSVEARIEQSREIAAEVSDAIKSEFAGTSIAETQFSPIGRMTAAQVDAEIAVLMRKRMLDDEDEAMLLILIAAAV